MEKAFLTPRPQSASILHVSLSAEQIQTMLLSLHRSAVLKDAKGKSEQLLLGFCTNHEIVQLLSAVLSRLLLENENGELPINPYPFCIRVLRDLLVFVLLNHSISFFPRFFEHLLLSVSLSVLLFPTCFDQLLIFSSTLFCCSCAW